MTEPDWTACVLPHVKDPERPRRAQDGARVCWGCHAKTLRALVQMAPLHRALGDTRAVATPAPRTGSRSAEAAMPLNPAAADCRTRILTALTEWTGVVVGARGLVPPPLDPEQTPQRAVDQLVGWLIAHHDWLLYEHPGAWAADLGDLRNQAWGICYPSGRTRREFAPCPTTGCQGTLAAWLAPGDLLPATLDCADCGARIPPARWLSGREPRWLTAVELAVWWTVPLRTVQRWAVEAEWPSDGGRPARYDSRVAQHTHDTMRVALTQVSGVTQDACHPVITGTVGG